MANANELEINKEKELVITRTLDAPVELVYQAWTEPERLAQWWGPAGFDIKVKQLELKPGGKFHYSMTTPDGNEMWGIFVYGAINPPNSIEFVNSFSDADGNLTRNPWMPTWPLEIKNRLTLKLVDGKTELTLRGGPINATTEEMDLFLKTRPNMEQGFAGTFAQLEAYLETIQK